MKPVTAQAVSESDLTFTLNSDGKSYTVSDCKESATGDAVIPATYNGLPVTHIGKSAFAECRIKSVIIPNGVTHIGNSAFSNCTGLKYLSVPSSVTSIGDFAFSLCAHLTDVDIPDGVIAIGKNAFENCSRLKTVSLPSSITSIGSQAFSHCYALTGIHVYIDNPNYTSDSNGVLFNKDKTRLMQAPGALSGAYAIPDSVISVDDYAFAYCKVTRITIGKGLSDLGKYAFRFCTDLNFFFVSDDSAHFSNDNFGVLFSKDKTKLIQASSALSGTYTIPNTVTTIGDQAFDLCSEMSGIVIPDSVTEIGDYAFGGCSNLQKHSFAGTQEQWDQIVINKEANQILAEEIVCIGSTPSSPTTEPSAAPTTQPTVIPTTQPTTIPTTQPTTTPTTSTSPPTTAPVDVPGDDSSNVGVIVAVVAVVLLAGSAGAFIIIKKKKA